MQTFDYIIVGAGSAGCVLANRLSEDLADEVLILEAGGSDKNWLLSMPLGFMMAAGNPAFDWGYTSEPDEKLDGRSLPVPRGKLLGGCSSINGMIYMRGHARDYDQWGQLGARGWSHDDVLPYFRKMERSWRGEGEYHGGSGPVEVTRVPDERLLGAPIRAAARAAGFAETDDLSGASQEGYSCAEATVDRRGRRSSTSKAYLEPALKRRNLQLESQAHVTRVLIEDGRAVGVEYRQGGELKQARARKEVVLSGGAYNSPQLLMLSGVGPAAQLAEHGISALVDAPGVGSGLMEHPVLYMGYGMKEPNTFLANLRIDRAARSVAQWALLGKGPFASQITTGMLALKTRPEKERPDIQLVFLPVRLDAKLWYPLKGPGMDHAISVMVMQMRTESRGSVSLRSADPFEKPSIELNLLSTPNDFAELRGGIAAVRRLFDAEPLKSMVASEMVPGPDAQSDEALNAYIRERVSIFQHPCGTCRMGEDDAAVVDSELRVKGVAGLRVVDASVFPGIPGANINAAVIMVAERASDLIRGKEPLAAAA